MKLITNIVAALVGLAFIAFGLNFWLHFLPTPPPPPAGTPAANFLGALYGSGYLGFVKGLEVLGGVLLLLPRLRNWGLVIVGAVLVNIAATHHFLFGGLKDPVVIGLILASLFLLYAGRRGFCCLACCGSGCCGSGSCGCGCCGGGSCGTSAQSEGCCGGSTSKSSGCCGENK